jgi:hypothetical protein
MRKLYNLFFWIDTNDIDNPVLRMESFDGSYDFNLAYDFQDIKELNISIDSVSLYSKVNVGSNNVTSGLFDNATSYYGWSKEEFFPLGQCNIDNEFNLVNDFVIDTNSIQDIMIGQSTDKIDSIFIIECDNVDTINKTAIAIQYDTFNNGDCYYNEGINNFNKVQNYSNQFVTTFGNFNGLGGYDFKASIGNILPFSYDSLYGYPITPTIWSSTAPGQPPVPEPTPIFTNYGNVVFTNENTGGNFDNGGYYDSTTGRYTIPVDGIYNFEVKAIFDVFGCKARTIYQPRNIFKFNIKFNLYDSVGNLKFQSIQPNYQGWIGYTNGSNINVTSTILVNAIATDYVEVFYQFALGRTTYSGGQLNNENPILNVIDSYFTVISTPAGQGGGGSGNNNANKYLYEFEYPIPQIDFINLLKNVTNQITFEKDGITRFGWIESMKRNDWNGNTQIKLITRNASNTQ